ncbi:MAG: S-layer homology domain-containing protein [Candidatus Heteroscillospira sp.]|jgi:hypothetical protein
MKKLLSIILAVCLLAVTSLPCAAAEFSDVPGDSWARDVIYRAGELGLMEGRGGNEFGYGEPVKRCEFVTLLCRMFDWELISPGEPSFSDVPESRWYYSAVETALHNGAFEKESAFRPEENITRAEMAVMFINALGYAPLAEKAEALELRPFTDVSENRGAIAVASDIGMINGVGGARFDPEGSALREHLAAMMVRVYDRLSGETQWLHGFYAFFSWPQHELAADMDAVSAGWSSLELSDGEAVLNTSGSWRIPESYESLTDYLETVDTPLNLSVYMDNSAGEAGKILTDAALRSQAAAAVLAELEREYPAIGKNPYAGVTIDFEGLTGAAQREGLTAFLTELRAGLGEKSLYVAVQPVTQGEYYDGFDYRAIGGLADRVILMAHDYNAVSLGGFEGSEYYKTTALTPLAAVYHSLRAITDPETGVEDTGKLALAISFSSLAWEINDGLLVSGAPMRPGTDTIARRLAQPDTVRGWSDTYKNPYAKYTTEDGRAYFLWYEDARSVSEKLRLARLFGIEGVSLWRMGTIPNETAYEVWSAVK